MNKAKQKSWFATLRRTKLLCFECKELKQVIKYLGDGRVLLECNHDRHTRGNKVEEVEHKLDNDNIWTKQRYND